MKTKCLCVLFAAALMVIYLSSGCSGGTPEPDFAPNDSAPTDFAPPSDTAGLKPAVLSFYLPGTEKKDAKEVLDMAAEASNLNIQLKFKWFAYNQYVKAINAAISSNENFDAFVCGRPEPGSLDIVDMTRKGLLKDISDLLPKCAPVVSRQLTREEIDGAKVDGKLIAVPSLLPVARCPSVLVRQDLAEKYGITSIKNFGDYSGILKKLRDNEKDLIPGIIGWYNIDIYAGAYGYVVLDYNQDLVYKWDDPDMKIIPWEQTPEFKESADMIGSWLKNGYIAPTNSLGGKDVGSCIFNANTSMEGQVELDIMGNGNLKVYNNYILYKDQKIQRVSPIGNIFEKGAVAFPASSANTERALMFMNWVESSQQNYDLFAYGIKDRHYKLKGERVALPEGMEGAKNPYAGWNYAAFANLNFERLPDTIYYSDNLFKDHIRFIETGTFYAPHEGFYPDYSQLQPECDSRARLYQSDILTALSMGTYDTSKTDSIIEELKNAGTGHIVEAIQKQLDKWRAAKGGDNN